MDAHINLTSMAIVGLSALLCGMFMTRLKQPALVGYIIAGVLLGPSAFGVVQNRQQIVGLAELGILLLLFSIGIELSVRAFIVTWKIALTAVALQIAGSLGAIFLCSAILGFTVAEAMLLGFVVALSSTAVAIKMLEETRQLRTRTGRIVVAILIGQDLAFLPMLLIVENIIGDSLGIWAIGQVILSIGVLAVLVQILNTRRVNLPFARIVMGNVDLSPLTGLVYCFGSGALFGLIGLTPAYGAFLAGLVIGRSNQREPMKLAVRPVQSILVMVFFLSIGLLIDLKFIVDNVGTVLVLLLIVTLFKTALNIGILRVLGETWQRATIQGLTLSQLGEFSFLLATAGLSAGTMGSDESRLVIAVTVLSLAISPLWLASARRTLRLASSKIDTLDELLQATYGDEVKIVQNSSRRFIFMCQILIYIISENILRWVPVKWKTILTTSSFLPIPNFFHQLKIKRLRTRASTPQGPTKTKLSNTKPDTQYSPSRERTDTSQKGDNTSA